MWIFGKRNVSDSYVLNLTNQYILAVVYKLVPVNLIHLNKTLVGQTNLIPFDFWKIISHDCNRRLSGKVLSYTTRIIQKRCDEKLFVLVSKCNNSISFSYIIAWYTPLMNPITFKRELTKFFEAQTKSKFRCYCYPSGWDPLENINRNRRGGKTKIVESMFGLN